MVTFHRAIFLACWYSSYVCATTTTTTSSSSSGATTDQQHPDATDHHHHERVQVNNDNEHHKQLYNHHHQQPSTNSRVLELSDRFLDIVNTPLSTQVTRDFGPNSKPKYQPWLVKFYAPWCGHCKRLEPVFNHVAQALHNTVIRVGRVDCTRFPSVGTEFKIHGYPTIMFISGPRKHTFQGDRTLDQIVKFATRMNSPPTRVIRDSLQGYLDSLPKPTPISLSKHEPESTTTTTTSPRSSSTPPTPSPKEPMDLFFGLIRPKELLTDVVTAFRQTSEKYQQHNEFYEFEDAALSSPLIFAYKHGRIILHEQVAQNMTNDVDSWVNNERFPDFMHVTRGNVYQLFQQPHVTENDRNKKHLIVTAVVEEDKLNRVTTDNENTLLTLLSNVANSAIEKTLLVGNPQGNTLSSLLPKSTTRSTSFSLEHHYGWIGTPDLANSIVAEHLPLPTLLIISRSLEDNNHRYYVFSDWNSINTESKIENIIELVHEGHFAPTVYANSWSFRLYRYAFDAKVSLTDMWVGNPVLTIVLFGLPLGFLSLILYSVCIGDVWSESYTEPPPTEDSEDEQHEKRE